MEGGGDAYVEGAGDEEVDGAGDSDGCFIDAGEAAGD